MNWIESRFISMTFANDNKLNTFTAPSEICGPNEHYESCGTACPATCDNQKPEICTLNCVRGCFCDEGLVRSDKGVCVRPTQCREYFWITRIITILASVTFINLYPLKFPQPQSPLALWTNITRAVELLVLGPVKIQTLKFAQRTVWLVVSVTKV